LVGCVLLPSGRLDACAPRVMEAADVVAAPRPLCGGFAQVAEAETRVAVKAERDGRHVRVGLRALVAVHSLPLF
jgi:hypothetical protein